MAYAYNEEDYLKHRKVLEKECVVDHWKFYELPTFIEHLKEKQDNGWSWVEATTGGIVLIKQTLETPDEYVVRRSVQERAKAARRKMYEELKAEFEQNAS